MNRQSNCRKLSLFAIFTLATATFVGCESQTQSPGEETSSEYLLLSEPADAKTPTELMESLAEPTMVVVAGSIDAGDLEPFEKGKATFVLSQLADEEHAQGDPDHANKCPFCKRKLESAPKVVVQFVDDSGNVLSQDARDLLGVKKGSAVVVKGTGVYEEPINMINLTADGIFVRTP
ncbi:hypothetical protein CA13_30820 [Planctomycetes bacterium CA13]|uniref:Uncharacterized protein n=1 Tax=Novipirellula herctigrandis TaxID=2527986 RepID=A0A5C5Z2N5_9BACT|nr:hypothetical protein CA13_30820 [Planctomycetes bacterium CA13]